MTDHTTLLTLLGEWVTVTHPDALHRVWHGRLASLMDCPSLVLQMPEGGTEVLPQAFSVTGAAPAAGGCPRPGARAEALRRDLDIAVAAYEALRVRTNTTSQYVQQQRTLPFGSGDDRYRILETLAVWTESPGPLKLETVTAREEA